MAAFYGTVNGKSSTVASRLGSKKSGIETTCQSYDGSVNISMNYDSEDNLIVRLYIDDDSSMSGRKYFDGSLDELKKILLDYQLKHQI